MLSLQAISKPVGVEQRRLRPLSDAQIAEIFAFEAPYLIEKLLKERILITEQEARDYFCEVKKYLIMNHQDYSRAWQMHSRLIDEVWHQFVLFTKEYTSFCWRFFNRYVHHAPSNAPKWAGAKERPTPTVDEFNAYYETLFGYSPPNIWKDDLAVTTNGRIINERPDRLTVRIDGNRAELVWVFDDRSHQRRQENRKAETSTAEPTHAPESEPSNERVLVRVDAWAEEALRFIARTGAFYVRELPGPLLDDERVELCATLVHHRALRIAP